ncbi:alpha/beta hydrolase [Actinoplanes sp. NPDC051633]|uniref:alpha/beta hydrolase n=1 Tax=Actinoplanes sp. NPDC051633 TaxID=3155670 RepID=UPI00344041AB
MPVGEPTAELWAEVRPLAGWPEADEDRMRALADAWREQGDGFIDAGAFSLGELEAMWTDDAGVAYRARAGGHLNVTNQAGNDMIELARRANAYADELTAVKNQINEIMASSPLTAWDDIVPGYRAQHVQDLANKVNQAMADGAARISGAGGAPLGRAQPPPAGSDPASVRSWWETQPDAAQTKLKDENPDAIRNLDGIPADVRDETNRRALDGEIARVEAERAAHVANAENELFYTEDLRAIDEKLEKLRYLDGLGSDHFILGLDASEDGKAIVAIGNPDTATNVSTVVPGTSARLGSIDLDVQRAERLAAAAEASADGHGTVSTIAWLGYDAPDDVGAAFPFQADAGAEALDRFQDGLRATHEAGAAHQSVVAHSYGAVVAGHAARDYGLNADDLILVAAPGTGVDHVSELTLDGVPPDQIGRRVHAIRSPDDWVRIFAPDEPDAIGHGLDPTDARFGAHVFEADNGSRDEHNGYFDEGTAALGSLGALIAPPAPR